jgi:hypothetical protein
MAGTPGPLISPWTYITADYQGRVLSVTVTFDNATGAILTVAAHKDAGCQYNRFYIGLGPDHTPDTAAARMAIPPGDTLIGVTVLNGFGFATIGQALASQVTAGP